MRRLLEQGAQRAVITLGADGAIATDGSAFWRIHAPKLHPVNTVGSGDAFTGGLAAGLVRQLPIPDACRLAAACGAANALTVLAGEVHLEDVQRFEKETQVERLC
jgi:fructose-1-phosphate kinase PfkB-like protein